MQHSAPWWKECGLSLLLAEAAPGRQPPGVAGSSKDLRWFPILLGEDREGPGVIHRTTSFFKLYSHGSLTTEKKKPVIFKNVFLTNKNQITYEGKTLIIQDLVR